ncbi:MULTISPECIES: DUF4870 domain-containing protein [Methylobacillus]|uniref:Transmembrane protein n=1 Tax=Methylobacillus flagellatus (strain ATCC 51484 / DSM 6875 / VKM B-1610 / KT) TaxID=265072 RepID=Q1H517_METFK|nr:MULTISPECIES: DUF4870 domain-containing protein [Methylobacillus]ABE48420.1 conserved hypothetical protein [Methylobacillus flagellatus KT]MPS48215.1 DUF4870 domain-containing protein [Methylobacillus sp.]
MSNLIPVPSADEKNIAVVTHLAGTVFSVFPALFVWLLKKDSSPFIAEQAREALNFQITLLIGYAISSILMVILVGFLLAGILWIANLILCVLAAIAASQGQEYRYPFTLRLIS